MTEYCSAEDVRKRLTTAGYKFFADLDSTGTVDSTETGDTITPAIVYAGNLIDACVLRGGCQIADARGANNAWLKDRAIDIAAYRVSTTGGGGSLDVLEKDNDAAVKMLRETAQVPGLNYNYPFPDSARSSRFPSVINVRR